MSETRFYIELPADEYGNTAYPKAVVEGVLAQDQDSGRPRLTFAAPAEIVSRWPSVYADGFGGYAETEGPARMLSHEEYEALIEGIRNPQTAAGPGVLVRLSNGEEVPEVAVRTTMIALQLLERGELTDIMALYELRELARDPAHRMWPGTPERLNALGLLDADGRVHDIIRAVVLSAVAGDADLHLVNPILAAPASTEAR